MRTIIGKIFVKCGFALLKGTAIKQYKKRKVSLCTYRSTLLHLSHARYQTDMVVERINQKEDNNNG